MNANDQAPISISVGTAPLVVGRSGAVDVQLFNPTVSRKHATLRKAGDEIAVTDHDSKFGTFVNDIQIRNHRAAPGDRIRFGTLLVYRVESNGLRLDATAQGIRLAASGLCLYKGQVPVVEQASFTVEADAFVGILGPSGSGKSTLLNCVAAYLQPRNGKLVFDGSHDLANELEAYRSVLGYIAQDDVVYQTLTIRENLLFAAQLRFGAPRRTSEVYSNVDQTLERVGLLEHAAKANYSGGQRKRLSVAIELLKRPRLLLLDEPTSALDPASAAHLMGQLRRLARQGTTVLCTTHLMDNLRLFDQIIVMGVVSREVQGEPRKVGRIAYAGSPDNLLEHFHCKSFADLYERLEEGAFQSPEDSVSETNGLEACGPDDGTVQQNIPSQFLKAQTDSWSSALRITANQLIADAMASGGWMQVWLIVWRAVILLRRDRGWLLTVTLQPLGLGALVCLTQFRLGADRSVFFFTVVIAIWLGMNNAIRELVRERKHYVRERLAGLRPGAYFASKWVICALLGGGQLVLLLAMLRLGCVAIFQEDTAANLLKHSWVWLCLVLWMCSIGGAGLGLLASALANSEQAAIATLPLLIMPQLLLSAVATGNIDESYNKARPFRPLAVTLTGSHAYNTGTAAVVDVLSLGCLSRPGALLAESPGVTDYPRIIWLADFCHLVILIFSIWGLAYFTFLKVEQFWPRLIGLG